MKVVKLIATVCFTAVLAVLLAMNVRAQDFNTNQRTYLTFSNAVELPGVTLQPGTYLFRLADSPSNRHIIQVLSQDEKQVFGTILAVPAERMDVTGENVVTFREAPENTPPAVQYWYYPGDKIGHEFVYPKDQAMKIAKRTNSNVLSTEGEVSSNSTVSSMNAQGETSQWMHEGTTAANQGAVQGATGLSAEKQTQQSEQTASAATGTTATTEQSAVGTTGTSMAHQEQPAPESTVSHQTGTGNSTLNPTRTEKSTPAAVGTTGVEGQTTVGTSAQDPNVNKARDRNRRAAATSGELPRTASSLPLSGLIGLLSLGAAFGLRRARQ